MISPGSPPIFLAAALRFSTGHRLPWHGVISLSGRDVKSGLPGSCPGGCHAAGRVKETGEKHALS
jgi:hypothetical protein